MATPYVISSDLVSAYPAKSLEIAQYIDGFKADLALVQNAQTGTTYSFLAADFTKLVTFSNASPVAVTLPLEAAVPWPAGTTLRLLNQGAGLVTVAGDVGVTINGTPLTLAQYKGAALIKTGTDTWTFAPFSSGVGAADFSDAATGSYSGYKYLTFTASGTITVTTAGFADIVVIGGGGGGGFLAGGGGGAGGSLQVTNAYLPVGTLTVTVGAGGAGGESSFGKNGTSSKLGDFYAVGGGGGPVRTGSGFDGRTGQPGGSGSGGSGGDSAESVGGPGVSGQGFAGGTTTNGQTGASGGGGASAVGVSNTSGAAGKDGGAGTSTSIAGTTPTGAYVAGSYAYGGGGGGGATNSTGGTGGATGGGNGASTSVAATAGTANTGGGGGGGNGGAAQRLGFAGGSGLVIVRVAV
jgi:hypothetical protein